MVNSVGLGIGGAVLGAVGIGLIAFGAYKRLGSKDYNIIYILLAVAGVIFVGVSIFMMIKGFSGGGKAKVIEQNIMSGNYNPGGLSPGGYNPGGYSPGSPGRYPQGLSPPGYPGSPGGYQMPAYGGYNPTGYPGMPQGGYAPYGFPVPQ